MREIELVGIHSAVLDKVAHCERLIPGIKLIDCPPQKSLGIRFGLGQKALDP
jgi:hypothetical protein